MSKTTKHLPHETRRTDAALSDFADYAAKQERDIRYGTAAPGPSEPSTATTHSELDDLAEWADFTDVDAAPPKVPLRDMFLGPEDPAASAALDRLVARRLEDGAGETVYHLGFENGVESMGLTVDDWNVAYRRLVCAAERAGAACRLLYTKNVGGPEEVVAAEAPAAAAATGSKSGKDKHCSGKILIRKVPVTAAENIETRIVVVGNVDAGKSSLLGVLVKGDLDDGRGSARVNLFRHKHEVETGRTSSVGMEILGFDATGDVVLSDTPGRKLTWEEIGKRSAKVITFSDLAGHERYLRTTVFGMLSGSPDYCLLMVAANNGLIGMSKEHLGIAVALNVPVMVVITKVDICPPQILQETLSQLVKILKSQGARKIPVFIRDHETCVDTASQMVSPRICPIFQVSNVTGENLGLVRTFLNTLPSHGHYNLGAPFEFTVNDTFSVPFVGTVVAGIIQSGVVHSGDTVLVGPDSLGQFATTSVRSIERKRIPVHAASAGQSASLALKRVRRRDVRKGMVVMPKVEGQPPPKVYREFVAEVLVLSHATTIKTKYQAMVHVGSVSQTCAIIAVDRPYIRAGDKATVAFRFVQRPEFVRPGERILMREGRTKGLGVITGVGYNAADPMWEMKEEDEEEGRAV